MGDVHVQIDTNKGFDASIDTVAGQGTAIQGQTTMAGGRTRASDRSDGSPRASSQRGTTTPRIASLEHKLTIQIGEADAENSSSEHPAFTDSADQRDDTTATYRLHSSGGPDQAEHYRKLRASSGLNVGQIIRIWKTDNSVMHLGTFALLYRRGTSWGICKVIREPSGPKEFSFKHQNAKVEFRTDDEDGDAPKSTGMNLGSVYVIKHDEEGWHEDTWLNLERLYDMGVDDIYSFRYCGQLNTRSLAYAREKNRGFQK